MRSALRDKIVAHKQNRSAQKNNCCRANAVRSMSTTLTLWRIAESTSSLSPADVLRRHVEPCNAGRSLDARGTFRFVLRWRAPVSRRGPVRRVWSLLWRTLFTAAVAGFCRRDVGRFARAYLRRAPSDCAAHLRDVDFKAPLANHPGLSPFGPGWREADAAEHHACMSRRWSTAAEREIETLSSSRRIALHGRDDVVLVDLRDIRELQREGRVPGAFHCPRGMLEFWIDPRKPVSQAGIRAGQAIRVLLRRRPCAPRWPRRPRSAWDLKPVAHIAGGFGAWKKAAAGGPSRKSAAR